MDKQKIKIFYSNHKIEILLFLSALLVNLTAFLLTYFFGSGRFLWSSDSEGYFDLIKNLLAHKGFYEDISWGPQAMRTPGYIVFGAFLYLIIGKIGFIIVVQNLLSAVSVVILYKLGKLVFGPAAAVAGSIFYIFESERIQVANQLMTETLFTFLFLLSLLFLWLFLLKKEKNIFIIFSAVFFSLALLTRPVIQLMPFAIPFLFLYFGYRRKKIKSYFLKSILFGAVVLLVASPWLIRNKILFNQFKLSSAGGSSLRVYTINFLDDLYGADNHSYLLTQIIEDLNIKNIDRTDWVKNSTQLLEFKYEDYYAKQAERTILEHPYEYAFFHLKRMAVFFIESSASRSYSAMLYNMHLPAKIFYPYLFLGGRALWFLMLILFLAGHIFNFKKIKNPEAVAFFLFLFLYFALLTAPNRDIPRQREPVAPILFLLAGNGLALLIEKWSKIRKPRGLT